MTIKKCCFIGHRNVFKSETLISKISEIIEDLIINYNVYVFIFGSRSNFDSICHNVVTNLKNKYSFIKRITYTCKSECAVLENDREELERRYSDFFKKEIKFCGVEEEIFLDKLLVSGRASYIERNQAMIDESDVCVFFYNPNYQPELRKHSKNDLVKYIPNSGTRLAYNYAVRKNKKIINVYDLFN